MEQKTSDVIFLLAYDPSQDIFTVEDILPHPQPPNEKETASPHMAQDDDLVNHRRNLLRHRSGHEPNLEQAVISQRSNFFRLPLELRQKVYIHLLGSLNPEKNPYDFCRLDHQLLPLDLLLTSRQIYREARFVPFQHNVFEFVKWNGTGLMYCDRFLRRLRPWQRRGVQNIVLDVLAVSLDNAGHMQHWLDVCSKLGCCQTRTGSESQGERGDLRTLKLTINGLFTKSGRDTFDLNALWVAKGLVKLTSLRLLEIKVVTTEGIDEDVLARFIANLRHRLRDTKIVSKIVDKGKESVLYIPISCTAF